MDRIKPTCDRKVRFYPTQKNTYGLLPGQAGTCPGATTTAGGCAFVAAGRKNPCCYVYGLMGAYKGVRNILEHNTTLLKEATASQKYTLLCVEFERFRAAEERRAKLNDCSTNLNYRLHWAGDVFDAEYAEALAKAMHTYSCINFWTYTRSFFAVPILLQAANLHLYLSLDPVNVKSGLETFHRYQSNNLQICYLNPIDNLKNEFDKLKQTAYGSSQLADDALGAVAPVLTSCPVDSGTLALEGGCSVCQKCLGLRTQLKPILFEP